MTNTVKERLQPELDKAKQESQQRAARISDILKSAASMTFDEIKGGSVELNTLTRRSVAELLEELNEVEASTDDMAEVSVEDTEVQLSTDVDASASTSSAPTWKDLVTIALHIVRDRKGDWYQQLKAYLNKNAEKFDGDMTGEYGDRYLKVKAVVQKIATWLKDVQRPETSSETESDIRPVSIEVLDDDPSETETQPAQ